MSDVKDDASLRRKVIRTESTVSLSFSCEDEKVGYLIKISSRGLRSGP